MTVTHMSMKQKTTAFTEYANYLTIGKKMLKGAEVHKESLIQTNTQTKQ